MKTFIKSSQYFQKKQLDSRCVQHTAPHFQASLSGCDMLYTIDNIYYFFENIASFSCVCPFFVVPLQLILKEDKFDCLRPL